MVFEDIFADMLSNKKLTELFIRGRKLSISLVFISILSCCSEKYYTKFNTQFYYENSKQKRASTNRI